MSFAEITNQIDLNRFNTPKNYAEGYFPTVLNSFLSDWIDYYSGTVMPIIDNLIRFEGADSNQVFEKARLVANGIDQAVMLYYKGRVYDATERFNQTLTDTLFKELSQSWVIAPSNTFYRARKFDGRHLVKEDLFHNPFELRHLVSTNRYSIPGFPSLYLGDSTYVCWEEYDRFRLRDLWFARFQNTRTLKVIKIQRYQDFLLDMMDEYEESKISYLMRYLTLYPLIIASTIKVKEKGGSFKPEYIIPQLLLQYVSNVDYIDGIMFPSSKVDYGKLVEVPAYNYVFPVRAIDEKGFCGNLRSAFAVSQPTTLEIEEIRHNPVAEPFTKLGGGIKSNAKIELIPGEKSPYELTSFGKLEEYLKGRAVNEVR